jgi:NADPH-ferrihemoprotein reductase
LEDFDPAALAEVTNAVFLMATYGEGEPTDNSAKFHAWLRDDAKTIESGFLSKTNFTVFGLGNRQYEHYNRYLRLTLSNLF